MMTIPPVVTPDQRQGREAACREIVRDVERVNQGHLPSQMGVVSPSPSVPRVAFLQRRREPEYRESLIIPSV